MPPRVEADPSSRSGRRGPGTASPAPPRSGYGWIYLVPLNDHSRIHVLTDDREFLAHLEGVYGARVRTAGERPAAGSCLVVAVREGHPIPSLDASPFGRAYVLVRNPLAVPLLSRGVALAIRRLGVEFAEPESRRPRLRTLRRSLGGALPDVRRSFLFFPHEGFCTHILDAADRAGLRQFARDLSHLPRARWLRRLPIPAVRLFLRLTCRERLLVLDRGL